MKNPSTHIFDFSVFTELSEEIKVLNQELIQTRRIISGLLERELNSEVLNFKEAQAYLKISKKTFLQIEKLGEIKPKRIGARGVKRYYKKDLMEWLQNVSKHRQRKAG